MLFVTTITTETDSTTEVFGKWCMITIKPTRGINRKLGAPRWNMKINGITLFAIIFVIASMLTLPAGAYTATRVGSRALIADDPACGLDGGYSCSDCSGYGQCLDNACGDTDDCCWPVNVARFEGLGWFGRGQNLPPLVTTSPVGTAQASAGVLPGATVLYGNQMVERNLRGGGRLTLTHALNDCGCWAVTGRFYGLQDSQRTFERSSATGNPILARPFILQQAGPGAPDALLVAFPGVAINGSVFVKTNNSFFGGDFFARKALFEDNCHRLEALVGYQFARLDDSLAVGNTETSISLDPLAPPVGTVLTILDRFRTRNEFHGGELGLIGNYRRGAWNMELLGKVGLGNMRQTVIIDGSTSAHLPPGPVTTVSGGLLTQKSNIGTYSRDRLACLPEVNATLAYQVNNNWSINAGYSFLYLNRVALSAGQVDPHVNLTQFNNGQLVGAAVPHFPFQSTDYWFQGFSLGAQYAY